MAVILEAIWSDGESKSETADQTVAFAGDWSDGQSIIRVVYEAAGGQIFTISKTDGLVNIFDTKYKNLSKFKTDTLLQFADISTIIKKIIQNGKTQNIKRKCKKG